MNDKSCNRLYVHYTQKGKYPDWSIKDDNHRFMCSYAFYCDKLKIMDTRYNNYHIDKSLKNEFIGFDKYKIFKIKGTISLKK